MGNTMTKRNILRFFVLLILFVLPVQIARADTGPKPTMEFTFSGEPVTITAGTLYECEESDCSDAAPLEELGPQRFICETDSCSALAYGFAPYHKLEIKFSDGKTRTSNVFQTAGFNSAYTVTIRPVDLLVEAQFSPLGALPPNITFVVLLCCCLCFIGILLVGLIIFLIRRRPKH
jgi:hypothetical protein